VGRADARCVADLDRRAGPVPDAVEYGDRLAEVEVEDPGPEGVPPGVGQRADHGDRARVGQGQQAALVAEQDRRALRGRAGRRAVSRVGQHRPGVLLIHVRIIEQAHPGLGGQHPPDRGVQDLLIDQARRNRLGQVRVRSIAERHLHVHAGLHRPRPGVGQVGREGVREQVVHGLGVADHEAVETPRGAQHVG